MSINQIQGIAELERELERLYGQTRMQQISDSALLDAAQVFISALESQFQNFKDTGASIEEITLSDPYWSDGARTVSVHWRGPKGRYRIIHLNEFGTVKNPNPRGKGAIARAIQASEAEYKRKVEEALRRAL